MNRYLVSLISLVWFSSASILAQSSSIMMTYYGTTIDAARVKTMDKLNAQVSRIFPQSAIVEAYTSEMVVRSLQKRGIKKNNVTEGITLLRSKKQPVVIVNAQLLDGVMTDKIHADVQATGFCADSVTYTRPLLYNSEDARWLGDILAKRILHDEDEEIVLVGHGSDDSANAMYALIDYVMQHEVDDCFHVGTIENYPDLNMILKILHKKKKHKVVLYPLLLIAGNHALQDIQGVWKNALEKEGYTVRIIQEGLLEIPEVQQRFIDKICSELHEKE